MVALLVSEACNIGMTPVTNPGHEALTRARLVHVDQYYLRADTIAAANAALIVAQSEVPIVAYWGDGLLASVDGLRFVVPVRTINSAPSPKYFGFKRGITWLNAVNDQVAGIGQMVVPGTPRDSLHILDALLNLDGGVKPEMVATDTGSYELRRGVRPAGQPVVWRAGKTVGGGSAWAWSAGIRVGVVVPGLYGLGAGSGVVLGQGAQRAVPGDFLQHG